MTSHDDRSFRDDAEWQQFLRTVSAGGSVLRDMTPDDRKRMAETVRDVNACFSDGWGPGAFDTDDWRAADRDHGQYEQRREHADDDRPDLLSWAVLRLAAFWTAAGIGTAVVGFVFGVMVVRSFL